MALALKRLGLGLLVALVAVFLGGGFTWLLLDVDYGHPGGILAGLAQGAVGTAIVTFIAYEIGSSTLERDVSRGMIGVCVLIIAATAMFRLGPDDELIWRLLAYTAFVVPWLYHLRQKA